MLRFIKYLVLLLISAWIGVYASHNPGYVLIKYGQYNIETSLWLSIVAIIIMLTLLGLLSSIIKASIRSITGLPSLFTPDYKARALKNKKIAIMAYLSQDWQHAEKYFIKSNDSEKDILCLIAALLSTSKGNCLLSNNHFKQMYNSGTNNVELINLVHANILANSNQTQESIQKIKLLPEKMQNELASLTILALCYKKLSQWDDLFETLNKIKRLKNYNEDLIRGCEESYYLESIKSANENNISKIWKSVPKKLKQEHILKVTYIRALVELKQTTAVNEIEHFMKTEIIEDLVPIYIEQDTNNEARFLKSMLTWYQCNPQSNTLLHGLAKTYHKHGDIIKSISYYEKIPSNYSYEINIELALLYFKNQDNDKAIKILRNSLK